MTTTRGRKTIEFDIPTIQKLIMLAEEKNTYSGRDPLYNEVVRLYKESGAPNADRLTPILVYQRVKKFNLEVKTAPGKRGRAKGEGFPARRTTPTTSPAKSAHIQKLRRFVINEGYPHTKDKNKPAHVRAIKLVDKVARGSMKAAIRLKCLECANFDREEIKNCQCGDTCSLWSLRPYQQELN